MITSPCINICKMDARNGLCQGCLRTIDEITAWSRLDDAGQQHILAKVARRRREQASQESDSRNNGNTK
ncbi:MAG: DUF1289 domain-containing protein [Gammaproteobacteria bacterium]|nr:DUF1289 domain-containing protein [Gammaproteobacteria bacterium]MBU1600504.1 DUF1289 domain-containing protein [Gammaproteobacteria bacterium]MBU2434960.1 DUF1289 domain-containing protein [Gammaproteobacteria bacterium]MBU2448196.1 DUF1289 domain-containing protein [Gammaproteobacteria bacterium]